MPALYRARLARLDRWEYRLAKWFRQNWQRLIIDAAIILVITNLLELYRSGRWPH